MAGIATQEELRRVLNVRAAGQSDDDPLLALLLDAATEAVERYTEREFTSTPSSDAAPPVTRVVVPEPGVRYARVPDIRELVELRADGQVLTAPVGVRFFARRGHPTHGVMLDRVARRIEIVGRFGFDPCPPDVKLAVLTWAARTYHERNARQADQVVDPEGGVSAYFRQVPPQVRATITRYRVPGA